jgi:lipid-A-disaccharide synthase
MTRVFCVAGEVSGDIHGAELLAALPETLGPVSVSGWGGPRMHALAPLLRDWLEDAAVLGLWEVLKKYPWFRARMDETIALLERDPPDVLLLIDYPGFNLRLAKALRERGYRGKIAYYISPQVWAWKRGRIREMGRTLDLMLCIFPFEPPLYEASGLRAEFVGHPLVDELAPERRPVERDPLLVGLFPGSRAREVETLFPALAGAARLLRNGRPDLRFVAVAANDRLAARMREIAAAEDVPIEISRGDIHLRMQTCACAAIASGTATLEAAFFGLPYCLVYKVAWLTAAVARRVMKVPYLGIVNNLAGREVVAELLQERMTPSAIADHLAALLESPERRESLSAELLAVAATLGPGGAHRQAARSLARLVLEAPASET